MKINQIFIFIATLILLLVNFEVIKIASDLMTGAIYGFIIGVLVVAIINQMLQRTKK